MKFDTFGNAWFFLRFYNENRAKQRSKNNLRSAKYSAEVMGGNSNGRQFQFQPEVA